MKVPCYHARLYAGLWPWYGFPPHKATTSRLRCSWLRCYASCANVASNCERFSAGCTTPPRPRNTTEQTDTTNRHRRRSSMLAARAYVLPALRRSIITHFAGCLHQISSGLPPLRGGLSSRDHITWVVRRQGNRVATGFVVGRGQFSISALKKKKWRM